MRGTSPGLSTNNTYYPAHYPIVEGIRRLYEKGKANEVKTRNLGVSVGVNFSVPILVAVATNLMIQVEIRGQNIIKASRCKESYR